MRQARGDGLKAVTLSRKKYRHWVVTDKRVEKGRVLVGRYRNFDYLWLGQSRLGSALAENGCG